MKEMPAKEKYYITQPFTSRSSENLFLQEKMELQEEEATAAAGMENQAYMGGETHIAISCIAEEISYMADYVFNDEGECEEIQYHPVSLGKTKKVLYYKIGKENSPVF